MRIISVVPSQTELLSELGLEDEVIGITKFCVHPGKWFHNKPRVGGTKTLDIQKIISLQPDLIIANKEENEKDQIEILSTQFNVYVSNVTNVSDALEMISTTGRLVHKEKKAAQLIDDIHQRIDQFPHSSITRRVAYYIWYHPWMIAGGDTFINSMITDIMGWKNVAAHKTRYPEISLEELAQYNPERILLSSEPFPFQQKHADEIHRVIPFSEVRFVDGEMFSWYGSRMKEAMIYLAGLLD